MELWFKVLATISLISCVVSVFFTVLSLVRYFRTWHEPQTANIVTVISVLVFLAILTAVGFGVFFVISRPI